MQRGSGRGSGRGEESLFSLGGFYSERGAGGGNAPVTLASAGRFGSRIFTFMNLYDTG